jgi:hypothetical protein
LLSLLFCSLQVFAQTDSDGQNVHIAPDTIVASDKEEKIALCMREYIKKQSKSYAKIAQSNLYDLLNNFDNIVAKIYGKKSLPDDILYAEKIELLARVQCEAYYKMGVLK